MGLGLFAVSILLHLHLLGFQFEFPAAWNLDDPVSTCPVPFPQNYSFRK